MSHLDSVTFHELSPTHVFTDISGSFSSRLSAINLFTSGHVTQRWRIRVAAGDKLKLAWICDLINKAKFTVRFVVFLEKIMEIFKLKNEKTSVYLKKYYLYLICTCNLFNKHTGIFYKS